MDLRPRDGGARSGSSQILSCKKVKGSNDKKHKAVREETFSSRLFFEKKDFSYVDRIVDPDREKRDGPKGYPPSSIFKAILLMYLLSMTSVLDLIRFLKDHHEWLVILGLKRRIRGRMQYRVPDRSTFYKFANRLGPGKIIEIFTMAVVQLIRMGIITGEKVSLDCSIIWAWFKDCKSADRPDHRKDCRRHGTRDRDASWEWDSHRERYVFGYKVHMLIDSASGLPVMLEVTRAGYGENRTVRWFIKMILGLSIHVKKFLADAAYDSNETRLRIIRVLKAIPLIPLNPRNCGGSTEEEKAARCKLLRYRFYAKNFIKRWWIDPDSEEFSREYDARTFSEQGFSIGRGSLNLDSLKHKGKAWATLHAACICMVMLGVAGTAVEIGRRDLMRSIKCFQRV